VNRQSHRAVVIHALTQVATLIAPSRRRRWVLVVILAAVVSVVEAVTTFLVFTLLRRLAGDADSLTLPLLGDLDAWVPFTGPELLIFFGATVLGVFLLRGALILVQHYVQYRMAENAGAALSAQLMYGYMSMPHEFHLRRNSSELIRNAFDGVRRFVDEGLVPAVELLSKLAIVVGVTAVLVATDPVATLLAVATLGPLTAGILRLVHPKVQQLGETAQAMTQQNLQSLQQGLQGAREISVLGRERTFADAYAADRRKLARARYLRRVAIQAPRIVIETGVVGFIVAVLSFTLAAGQGLAQTLPALGLFGYAAARLIPELQHITKALNSLKFVGPALEDIRTDLSAVSASARPATQWASARPLPFTAELKFERVRYRYPDSTHDALTDIELTITPGTSVGVVGPSGGGKSTLVDLVLGVLHPVQGRITADGRDIASNTRAWQANVGVVPQTIFLVDDTLRANIALGVPPHEIDDAAMAQAVHQAQLDELVADLPCGLDTVVGEHGVRLSGGQRQRIAIGRALYLRPRLLVFDEATSALDTETEATLMSTLESLRGQLTLVVVAHRLSTVEACDTVLLIREGRLVDHGPLQGLSVRHKALRAPHAQAQR
jgi:ABC-type multidrug transport system fused ATPase/permease subunit